MSRLCVVAEFAAFALLFAVLTANWHFVTADWPWPIHHALVAFGACMTLAVVAMGVDVARSRREP